MTKKTEMWRKYKGTTAEELCAAIRELWLAKYANYIRMLNEVPNKLIEDIATIYASYPKGNFPDSEVLADFLSESDWPGNGRGRRELRELEKFLDKQPFGDHFSDDLLADELFWKDPDAPLSEYEETEKRKKALIKKYSIDPNDNH